MLLRICGADGLVRGLGFVADRSGTVVTARQVVAGVAELVLHTAGGQARVLGRESVEELPGAGLALLHTAGVGGLPDQPPPIAAGVGSGLLTVCQLAAGVWELTQLQGGVRAVGPDGVLELELPQLRGPVTAGAPVLCAESGAVLGVLAPGPGARPVALPLDGPELAALRARNAEAAPAHGRALNLGGVLQLASVQLGSAGAGPGRIADLAADRVDRPDGLTGEEPQAVVSALLGPAGSGRSTELAALAVRRMGGPGPLPTIWLRGADLLAGEPTPAAAVQRQLGWAAGLLGVPEPGLPEVLLVCAAAERPLLVLLDGLEEAPAVVTGEWLAGTVEWLAFAGARLLVAARPEGWPGLAGAAVHGLGELPAEAAARVARRYGTEPFDGRPLALRLAGETGAPADLAELYAGWLERGCREAARAVAAAGAARRAGAHRRGGPSPELAEARERERAGVVAERLREVARRMLSSGHGTLDAADFDELFPATGGWAGAALGVPLLVPAGRGYRFPHEDLADWLQAAQLDLDAALRLLLGEVGGGGDAAYGAPDGSVGQGAASAPAGGAPDGHPDESVRRGVASGTAGGGARDGGSAGSAAAACGAVDGHGSGGPAPSAAGPGATACSGPSEDPARGLGGPPSSGAPSGPASPFSGSASASAEALVGSPSDAGSAPAASEFPSGLASPFAGSPSVPAPAGSASGAGFARAVSELPSGPASPFSGSPSASAPAPAGGVPRWRVGVVGWALRRVAERYGAQGLDGWLWRLWRGVETAPGPEEGWWARRLLVDGLGFGAGPAAHRELLERIAERGGGGLEPGFWTGLPLPVEDRVGLLRRLVTAGQPAGPAVAGLLAAEPRAVLPLLCGWYRETGGSAAGDLADDLLFAHRHGAVDDLTECLAIAAHPRADALLARLAAEEPSALCRAVDRWSHRPGPHWHVAAAVHGLRVAPYAAGTGAELLWHAARTLLAREEEPALHGAALALLVREPAGRVRHLERALEAFLRDDPFVTAEALAPVLADEPGPVLEAFRRRLAEPGAAVAEVLRVLAGQPGPELLGPALDLAAELLERAEREGGPARERTAGQVVEHLVGLLVGPAGPEAVVAAAAGGPPGLRAVLALLLTEPEHPTGLLAALLAEERDPLVLVPVVERLAARYDGEPPDGTRELVRIAAQGGGPGVDAALVRGAGRSAGFARLLAHWPPDEPGPCGGPLLTRMRLLAADGRDPQYAAAEAERCALVRTPRAAAVPVPTQHRAHGTL
ncbi:hypothetical protein GCM10020229_41340 [Kitasatospora albolonga]|uniref:hypothetical protein n=1 Tax=Kitasatospora albolonga TaxID=68173 RepID=UPI0031EB296D